MQLRDHPSASGRSWRVRAAGALLVAATLLGGWAGGGSVARADAPRLGQTAQDAAVSCWDIKQRDRSATDGSYWLQTPQLVAPQQFHCDMTTDGGGWVLVGRGREGWSFAHNGQGTAEQVRTVVDGAGAFLPRALSGQTIDGLLNGTRPDALSDGVRLRRSRNTSGTSRQEVRIRLADRDRWAWAFAAGHRLAGYRFDTRSYSGGTSDDFGSNNWDRRVVTIEQEAQGWRAGWAYGRYISGSTSPSSHLWSPTGRDALPFTQVYLRPRLTEENTPFPVVPDAGAPAESRPPLLSDRAERGSWGVTGRANGRTDELNTEVQAFAQSGRHMIVGGNFRHVQRGQHATGADRVEQPYLAAFDVDTGDWLPDFRPVLDGQVKDAHALPDGSIVVAGEFTTVNGAPAAGVAALDPLTGALDDSFPLSVENRISGQSVSVTSLDAEGPWLYLGGRFTHLLGGGRAEPVYARMAARVAIADGTPDPAWNPELDGSVLDLDASSRGDRVYVAGYFSSVNGVSSPRVAVLSTGAGAGVVPGLGRVSFSNSTNYQQAVREVGDRLWHGGSQHLLFSYRRSDLTRLSGNITLVGGDFQTINDLDGVVYGGCHCNNWNYSEAYTWRSLGSSWTQGDAISYVGAWDAETGLYLPEFHPELRTSSGQGPWRMVTDDRGVMWVGGDFERARTTTGTMEWVGGFVRYAKRDATAPSAPANLAGTDDAGTTTLTWGAASDDRGGVDYEIIRDDRVTATTRATTASFDTPADPARYAVRAVDRAGNRSATTPVVVVTPDDDGEGPVTPSPDDDDGEGPVTPPPDDDDGDDEPLSPLARLLRLWFGWR